MGKVLKEKLSLLHSLTVFVQFDGALTHGWHLNTRNHAHKFLVVFQNVLLYKCTNARKLLEYFFFWTAEPVAYCNLPLLFMLSMREQKGVPGPLSKEYDDIINSNYLKTLERIRGRFLRIRKRIKLTTAAHAVIGGIVAEVSGVIPTVFTQITRQTLGFLLCPPKTHKNAHIAILIEFLNER